MLPREHYLRQPFTDATHFPEGLEASGQFSGIQARLLRKHGQLITALINDEVTNPNDEDLHLLKVLDGHSVPRTPVEQAWLKYRRVVAEREAQAYAESA